MLIFTATQVTATQAGARSARHLHAPTLYVAAVLLLVTTLSYGQGFGPPAGAPPPGAPPGAGPGGMGPPPIDDGIPPPVRGTSDTLDAPVLVQRPKLSEKAPQPVADPRNFEGVWYHFGGVQSRIMRDLYGARLAYTEEARKILKHRRENENAGTPLTNPASRCYPAPTWNFEINAPFQVVQTDDLIYFVFQEFHAVWQIHMNQRNSAPAERSFGGYSVGHWDGNTLVVDTTNFKEPMWLDTAGTPASEDVRLTRRIRKLEDGKSLEVLTIVNDPQMYATPWSFARSFSWAPNAWMLGEYDCEKQVGESGGATNYGLSEDK
jgi:hypothetical protein